MKPIKSFIQALWSSKVSLAGAILVTVSSVLIIVAYIMDMLGIAGGSYQGLIAYALMPVLFITGLLLIPWGIWRVRRKAARRGEEIQPLMIDFGNPFHQRRLFFILVLTVINSIILSVALYEGYHYTDSNNFCGLVCHQVMKPEYTAYQRSPHARVNCVQCHIGGGASWYVKSKMSGLRQVWAVLTNSYHRPIPSPVENLRPARETCEECHWPQVFHGRKVKAKSSPAADGNLQDPQVTMLLLNIGGPNSMSGQYEGIHWHVSRAIKVEYLSVDARRSQIKRVRVTRSDGSVTEYVHPGLPEPQPGTAWRTMDCVDCHNRPTHIYDDPGEAVDRALMERRLDASLPEVRTVAVAALTADYPTDQAAKAGIATRLAEFYKGKGLPPELLPAVEQAASVLTGIWRQNVFPEMKVRFGTYPNQLGHRQEKGGCFRCHDEEHVAGGGKAIFQDCDRCHEVLADGEKKSKLAEPVRKMLQ